MKIKTEREEKRKYGNKEVKVTVVNEGRAD